MNSQVRVEEEEEEDLLAFMSGLQNLSEEKEEGGVFQRGQVRD